MDGRQPGPAVEVGLSSCSTAAMMRREGTGMRVRQLLMDRNEFTADRGAKGIAVGVVVTGL